ncbi:hypothetical protein BH23ACT9_BH23ACT9_00980 [soil metagenome]
MRREGTPTRRRVVGLYALLGVIAVLGLVGLAELLRHDHPPAGPPTPELADQIDSLRDEVSCPEPPQQELGPALAAPAAEPAVTVDSNRLYDCPRTWDGRRVRYVGEAVGALLDRGDHAWVQLNDDVYADGVGPLPTHRDFRGGNAGIGARLDADQAQQLTTIGGPRFRGDLVEVVATFQRVDPDSAEVAVLLVESLTVLRGGEPLEQPRAPARPVIAGLAALIALGVVVLERRRRDR